MKMKHGWLRCGLLVTAIGWCASIQTATAQYAVATSTIPAATSTGLGSSAPYIVWGAGTYMTFTFDATNTAVCTPGVEAFSS